MSTRRWSIAAVVLVLMALMRPAAARPLDVVASFTVLADMVRQIGGAGVVVRSLVGPNGDPHVYEPTPEDAAALTKADLIVVNGLGLEGWIDRLIAAAGSTAPVVVASHGITPRHMTEGGAAIIDPHAWNSAANAAIYAVNITRALAAAAPGDAAAIRARGAAYAGELRTLDGWARQLVASVPADRRRVITSHDAFGYLGAAYGIEFLAPIGLSTDAEASAAAIAGLVDQIRQEKVKVVFLENSTDPRLAEQIAATSGAHLGGTLYAEALSPPAGPAATYAAMFRSDITTLVAGMRAK